MAYVVILLQQLIIIVIKIYATCDSKILFIFTNTGILSQMHIRIVAEK